MTFRNPSLRVVIVLTLFALLGIVVRSARPQSAPALPPPPAPMPDGPPAPGDDDVEVLTRGPVHEAFAEQFNADPTPGLTVPKEPPADIEEMVPETIPDGDNVQWIKGYWGWDDEREGFIWISGFWRDIPVGQRWVPGYWHHVADGYQWVSGFWINEQVAELDYLPQPPASLDVGPSTPAPSDNHFWVPGSWVYVSGNYQWRAGFWNPCYDDWIWVPDRYIWTPYGFVFRPGYYDRRLPQRGCLFAPVYFAHVHYWHRPRVFFTPTYVIDTGPLCLHLFVRPSYGHYYFGDFYADRYAGFGYQPWYTCDFRYRSTYRYDPLLVFYVGYHRRHGHVDYCNRLASWNNYYHKHENQRPPRTVRDFDRFAASHGRGDHDREVVKNVALGRKLDDVVKEPRGDHHFRRISTQERTEQVKVASSERDLARLRKNIESDNHGGGRHERLPPGQIQAGNGVSGGPSLAETGGAGRDAKSRKLKLPNTVSGTSGHAIKPLAQLPDSPGGTRSKQGGRDGHREPGNGNVANDSNREGRVTITPRAGNRNQIGNIAPGADAGAGSNEPDSGNKGKKRGDKENNGTSSGPTPRIVPRRVETPPNAGAPNLNSGGASPRRGDGGNSNSGGNNPGNFSPPKFEMKRGGTPSGTGNKSSGPGGNPSNSGKKQKRSGSAATSGAKSSNNVSLGSFGDIQKGSSRSIRAPIPATISPLIRSSGSSSHAGSSHGHTPSVRPGTSSSAIRSSGSSSHAKSSQNSMRSGGLNTSSAAIRNSRTSSHAGSSSSSGKSAGSGISSSASRSSRSSSGGNSSRGSSSHGSSSHSGNTGGGSSSGGSGKQKKKGH